MCILLKLDYAKVGVSNLFFQKLSKENHWGLARPPFGKRRVKGKKVAWEAKVAEAAESDFQA